MWEKYKWELQRYLASAPQFTNSISGAFGLLPRIRRLQASLQCALGKKRLYSKRVC